MRVKSVGSTLITSILLIIAMSFCNQCCYAVMEGILYSYKDSVTGKECLEIRREDDVVSILPAVVITEVMVSDLVQMLKEKPIYCLRLLDVFFEPRALLPMIGALQTNAISLAELSLRVSHIDRAEILALAESLKTNTKLTKLDLRATAIKDDEMRALAQALRINKSLTELDLSSNNLGPNSIEYLVEVLLVNPVLTKLDLSGNNFGKEGIKALLLSLVNNYSLLQVRLDIEDSRGVNKLLLRNDLLIKLLHRVKCASSFTFAIGLRHNTPVGQVLPAILEFAGLHAQDYNNEYFRNIIFTGSLEEVIRLFYYGNDVDYREILREVNQIRRLQREILQENYRVIPEGLVELPEEPRSDFLTYFQVHQRRDAPHLQQEQVATIFWTS